MNIYYDSPDRFTNRIVKTWIKSGTKFNAGNVNILKYSWIAARYWANRNGERVAKVNREDTNQIKLY